MNRTQMFLSVGVLLVMGGLMTLVSVDETETTVRAAAVAVFFLGAFVTAYGSVASVLQNRGIESFAVGAISAVLGLTLIFSIAVANEVEIPYYPEETIGLLAVLGVGAFLVIVGFTMEATDLNKRLVAAVRKFSERLSEAWNKLDKKMLIHPLNLLSVAAIVIVVWYDAFPAQIADYRWFWFAGLVFLNLALLFHEATLGVISLFGSLLNTIVRFVAKGVRNFKSGMIKAGKWTVKNLAIVGTVLHRVVLRSIWSLIRDSSVLMLIGAVALLFIASVQLEVRFAVFVLALVAVLGRAFMVHPESLRNTVAFARVQRVKYAAKYTAMRARKREGETCPGCGTSMQGSMKFCAHCGHEFHRDMISGARLTAESEVVQCIECGSYSEWRYLQQWLAFRDYCPFCKRKLDSSELHPHLHDEDVEAPDRFTRARSMASGFIGRVVDSASSVRHEEERTTRVVGDEEHAAPSRPIQEQEEQEPSILSKKTIGTAAAVGAVAAVAGFAAKKLQGEDEQDKAEETASAISETSRAKPVDSEKSSLADLAAKGFTSMLEDVGKHVASGDETPEALKKAVGEAKRKMMDEAKSRALGKLLPKKTKKRDSINEDDTD